MADITYCIRGNNRVTHKKEIIRDGFASEEEALSHLRRMAKIYYKRYSYARVARSDAYIHSTQR